jgi:HD superfamily phosphohydrolase YqeK
MQHGPNAVPIAQDFLAKNYPNLSKSDKEKILNAIKNHTIGRCAPDNVSACLWDGDRIRLSWEMGYRPECFSTIRGRQIANLPQIKQVKYISDQNDFLINNNIRTREQIEFERKQDEIQNKIGTQFKLKIQ